MQINRIDPSSLSHIGEWGNGDPKLGFGKPGPGPGCGNPGYDGWTISLFFVYICCFLHAAEAGGVVLPRRAQVKNGGPAEELFLLILFVRL